MTEGRRKLDQQFSITNNALKFLNLNLASLEIERKSSRFVNNRNEVFEMQGLFVR